MRLYLTYFKAWLYKGKRMQKKMSWTEKKYKIYCSKHFANNYIVRENSQESMRMFAKISFWLPQWYTLTISNQEPNLKLQYIQMMLYFLLFTQSFRTDNEVYHCIYSIIRKMDKAKPKWCGSVCTNVCLSACVCVCVCVCVHIYYGKYFIME